MSMFLQTFYDESFEGLEVMETGLLDLDVGAADEELINSIFRAAHSIKGGSATFGLAGVAEFTHLMETLLDQLRDGSRDVTQGLVDTLLKAVDVLRDMLTCNQSGEPEDGVHIDGIKIALQQALGAIESQNTAVPHKVDQPASTPAASGGWLIHFAPHHQLFATGNDPVRIFYELADLGELHATAVLDDLPDLDHLDPEESYLHWVLELRGAISLEVVKEVFAWVEDDCAIEIESIPVSEQEGVSTVTNAPNSGPAVENHPPSSEAIPAIEVHALKGEVVDRRERSGERRSDERRKGASADTSSIRVGIEKVDAVINLVGELVITQSMLSTLGEKFEISQLQQLRDGLTQLEHNTRELQADVMRMRMLPISFVFNRFPRMARDLSQKLGKEINLVMSGEGTELDKTLIEKISDPLVHLVRNSIDHGIESIDVRLAAGKSATGTVNLNAFHKGGNIVIEVKDDGKGLDANKILTKAIEKGLVAADAQLTEEQIFNLLFMPGFSTAEQVSDLSGRGVGMDVVRRNIMSLGGSVEIRPVVGDGSTMTVRLPLTLAILDGQSVRVGDNVYIIPLASIIESIQVKDGMVNHVAGGGETFQLRGTYLPIIRLAEVFGIESESKGKELHEGLLVVVEGDGQQFGLFVDDLLGQQQVVIKSLEANYQKVRGLSGATIMGDGSVALILDIPGLRRGSASIPPQRRSA